MEFPLFILIAIVFFSYPFAELIGIIMLIQSLATCRRGSEGLKSASWTKRITILLTVSVWPGVLFAVYVSEQVRHMRSELNPHLIAVFLWVIASICVMWTLLNPRNSLPAVRRAYQSAFVLAAISLVYAVHANTRVEILCLIPLVSALNQFLCFLYLRKVWKSYTSRKTTPGGVVPLFHEAASREPGQGGEAYYPQPVRKERKMNANRVVLVVLILLAVSAAWMVLGQTISHRTAQLDETNSAEIASLWGPKVLVQLGPYWTAGGSNHGKNIEHMVPQSSDIRAQIDHANRYKGLLWFSTFTVDFDATYVFSPSQAGENQEGMFCLPLPRDARGYDRMVVEVDGVAMPVSVEQIAAGVIRIPLQLDAASSVRVCYATGGQDVWLYSPAGDVKMTAVDCDASQDTKQMYGRGAGQDTIFAPSGPPVSLPKFQLTLTTNFDEIDYPRGTTSPTSPATQADSGMTATWKYDNAVRSQAMGITMPQRTNAGPIAARMSYYAPVSLVLFVAVFLTLIVRKGVVLHPMHFAFIAAGFFAFQILLSYLADIMSIHLAFWISACVSVALVVSYMRLVAGAKLAVFYAGGAQLVYLVGFSYAFFWVGRTGLTVTILSIVTLFIMMQATGRLDWQNVFGRSGGVTLPAVEKTPIPPSIMS